MSARGLLVWQVGAIAALGFSFVATGCVVKEIPLKDTPGSFKVEVLSSDAPPAECGAESPLGSVACPLPFPELAAPFSLRVRATAYDRGSESREPAPMAVIALRIDGLAAVVTSLGTESANVLRRKVAVRLRGALNRRINHLAKEAA